MGYLEALNEEIKQDILHEMISCDTTCADLGDVDTVKKDTDKRGIDWLVDNIPGLEYVRSRVLNYIFSNGLSTGEGDEQDTRLDVWLYEKKNTLGETNYNVLRDVIGDALIYGECGLRLYDGNLYRVRRGKFGILVFEHDGIKEIAAYFIRADGKDIDKDFTFEPDRIEEYEDANTYFLDRGMVLLDGSEFVSIRNDTSELHGRHIFSRDKQRIDLLISTYKRLNYDIDYDGPGRIIVRPRSGYVSGDENDISTGQVIAAPNPRQRNDEAMKEVLRVGREIKNSKSDSIILLSDAFEDHIEHLPRVTKATEFFGWLNSELVIVAQMFGMSPTLLEVGNLHGNVSVEKIIDNAMLNTIIPMRESYAVQFSDLLAGHIGVTKIFFDKYDMEQVRDENEIREKVAAAIRELATASKALGENGENVSRLVDEFAEFLRASLYTPSGELKSI